MHKFMRTIGFSTYEKKKEMEELLAQLARQAKRVGSVVEKEGSLFCELRAEVAEDMGVAMAGEVTPDGKFYREYYYPYVINRETSSTAECSIQRHAERETYAGMLDDYRMGVSLIYYMENSMEYRMRLRNHESIHQKSVALTGLSCEGKILLPVLKTKWQTENSQQETKKRCRLIEAAKSGDEEAIETLTMEDMDLYSEVSQRIMTEDLYSVIDTCFMPWGVECDQYSVIGEIKRVETKTNRMTNEEIYNLQLECNDVTFSVAINQRDLLGEPAVGRRFKGTVWLQGTAQF